MGYDALTAQAPSFDRGSSEGAYQDYRAGERAAYAPIAAANQGSMPGVFGNFPSAPGPMQPYTPDMTFTMPTSGSMAPSGAGLGAQSGAGASTGASGLAAGGMSVAGMIPGLLNSLLTPSDADAKTRAVGNIGSAVASGAIGAGTGAMASGGAGAVAGGAAALPAIAMAVGMSMDAMRQEKNVKHAIGKFEQYMATVPGLREEWEKKVGNVQQTLGKLKSMTDAELSAAVNQASNDVVGLQTAKSNAISGGGTTGDFSAYLPNIALAGLSNAGTAMTDTRELQKQAVLNSIITADTAANRGLNVEWGDQNSPNQQLPYDSQSLAMLFAPEYFKEHRDFVHPLLKGGGDPVGAEAYLARTDNSSDPYRKLIEAYKSSGYDIDQLENFGMPFGTNAQDLNTSYDLTMGANRQQAWDPEALSVMQGMKPGNFQSTLNTLNPGSVGSMPGMGNDIGGAGKRSPQFLTPEIDLRSEAGTGKLGGSQRQGQDQGVPFGVGGKRTGGMQIGSPRGQQGQSPFGMRGGGGIQPQVGQGVQRRPQSAAGGIV